MFITSLDWLFKGKVTVGSLQLMRVNERMNELDENNVRSSRGGILVVPLVHFSMCPFCVVIDIICTGLNKK